MLNERYIKWVLELANQEYKGNLKPITGEC